MGIITQLIPLAEEQKLNIRKKLDVFCKRCAVIRNRICTAHTDLLIRPLRPGFHAEVPLAGHKEGVILHPRGVFRAEGGAFFPQHGGDFTALYHAADSALYHAKKSGKDTFVFYDPEQLAEEAQHEADT